MVCILYLCSHMFVRYIQDLTWSKGEVDLISCMYCIQLSSVTSDLCKTLARHEHSVHDSSLLHFIFRGPEKNFNMASWYGNFAKCSSCSLFLRSVFTYQKWIFVLILRISCYQKQSGDVSCSLVSRSWWRSHVHISHSPQEWWALMQG